MRVVGAVIWSAVALVAAHASANPFCDEEYKKSVCPIYCTGVLAGQCVTSVFINHTRKNRERASKKFQRKSRAATSLQLPPRRRRNSHAATRPAPTPSQLARRNRPTHRCCKHVGTSATILSVPLPTHSRALAARVDQYRRCTGARITLAPYSVQCSGEAYCGGFAGLYEIGLGALEDAKGASVYDAYMTQAPDVPLLAGYVGDLAPLIKKTPALKWGDVMSQVRKQNAVGAKQVAMPFDFDSLGFLLRDDLVAAYPGPEPRTFEELAAFAEYFYDKDLNGDGVPDFGLCSLNGAAVAGPQALLMQIAAAKLQYLGSEQGLFLFRQRTSTRAPDDLDALTATSYASSTRASYVTPTPEHVSSRESSSDSPCCVLEAQVTNAHLEERASKRSAVVRLASAPMLDDPISP